MLSREEYIRLSLENNLFWLRIMKEHAIFIESSMLPPDRSLTLEASRFKRQFEQLLATAIRLSNGSVSKESLQSGQFYTRYTDEAERITQKFTGITINRNLTQQETNIEPATPFTETPHRKEQEVSSFNQSVINMVSDFIRFKTSLYNSQASCRIATMLYTSTIQHVIHEAQKYVDTLNMLQKREAVPRDDNFWNHIMSDHAKVIRGLLDPTEVRLFNEADRFAKVFDAIIQSENNQMMNPPENAMIATREISEFKSVLTRGLIECKIKAIMMPLFTDHLLREANHYLYLLQF
ncbi:MAG: DUF2935 domain-containing protein [Bacillota bacterium]|nr:DUF2935 domain-containing protein [Bacillota bacterium]